MKATRVFAVYFSATLTTRTVTERLAQRLAERFETTCDAVDFSLPAARGGVYTFQEGDLVVFGMPVYAGRLPNLIMPFVKSGFAGNGALAVPVVLYGNRNFDDGLIELRDLLEKDGFHTVAGAAFVGEHSFSRELAAGRPDAHDLKEADEFADGVAEKVALMTELPDIPAAVEGFHPIRPYYTPRDRFGSPIDIRRVKPKTSEACDRCGLCQEICPMGSIDPADPTVISGICIKCCACEKRCPKQAKYFDDEKYLYHKHELEDVYARRAENRLFL